MKKCKLLLAGFVFLFAFSSASLSFGAGWPFFVMIWEEQGQDDPYYILIKFDQNQFSQNQAETLSQFVVGMAEEIPGDDYGIKYTALSAADLAKLGLGDADYVREVLTSAGWDHVFIDLTIKSAPVAGAENYNMDIFYYDAIEKGSTYILSLGIPNYWLSYID